MALHEHELVETSTIVDRHQNLGSRAAQGSQIVREVQAHLLEVIAPPGMITRSTNACTCSNCEERGHFGARRPKLGLRPGVSSINGVADESFTLHVKSS